MIEAMILTMTAVFTTNVLVAASCPEPRLQAERVSVRATLDSDGDGMLNGAEIENAASALRTLDANGDGSLSPEEMGLAREGRGGRGRRGRMGGPPGGFGPGGFPPGGAPPDGFPPGGGFPPPFGGPGFTVGSANPFDIDQNGVVDAAELERATTTLRRLDGNRDGQLSKREFDHVWPPASAGDDAAMPMPFGRDGGGRSQAVAPEDLEPKDGTATIPDRATFEMLAYRGENVMIDTQLRNLEFVKFVITGAGGEKPVLWFMNTKTWRAHPSFMGAMGIGGGGRGFGRPGGAAQSGPVTMRGVIVHRPFLRAPNGATGLYTFEFEPNDSFAFRYIKSALDVLAEHSELLSGRMAYHPLGPGIAVAERERDLYERAGLKVFGDDDLYAGVAFLPLHRAKSFGRLRFMRPEERPGPRDVVIYATLPSDMPRVAGIITAVRQTPLSHVNLRAVQDDVPNAFIQGAATDERLRALEGTWVEYEVTADGYSIHEADAVAVEKHFAALRPRTPSTPERDLSVHDIRSLDDIGHGDWKAFGVKAANLAEILKLSLPTQTVETGYAIPFSFYDDFMRSNGIYDEAREMISKDSFEGSDRSKALAKLRNRIEKAPLPEALEAAIEAVRARFGADTSIRCRSSTNNEDLPGFSGAGLYESYTHKKDEGKLSNTVRQVWASAWTDRAFDEREFYRIDHFATAMGVLLHPNFSNERANGVAVSSDVVYESENTNYVNVQIGADLVTNPNAESSPEEILISKRDWSLDRTVRLSNASPSKSLLTGVHLDDLRESLAMIERRFRELLDLSPAALFSIEIEFKVTADGKLAIKQARPWVY